MIIAEGLDIPITEIYGILFILLTVYTHPREKYKSAYVSALPATLRLWRSS
jgi:hypothetical protein